MKVKAGYSKNRKECDQPILRADAAWLRGWLRESSGEPPRVPKNVVNFLKRDLKAAGIEYRTESGFADFHSLRAYYIVSLWKAGVDIKLVQILARHSSITLTMDLYCKVTGKDIREALDVLEPIKEH